VSGAVTTWLMDNLNQEKVKAVRRGTLLYTLGIAAMGIAVILFTPEIIYILGSGKYPESVPLMPGFVVAVVLQSATTVFTIMLTYQKRVLGTAVWTGIVAVGSVAAKYFLLPWYDAVNPGQGVMMLPYINVVSFAVLFITNYVLVCRTGLGRYLNIKAIGIVLVGLLGFMLVAHFLYDHLWLRLAAVGILCVAAVVLTVKYRELIMKIIRKKFKKKKKTEE